MTVYSLYNIGAGQVNGTYYVTCPATFASIFAA